MGGGFITLKILGRLRGSSGKGEVLKNSQREINTVEIITTGIKSLELTPEIRTYLIYLREPIGLLVFENPCSRLSGKPIDPKTRRVGKGYGELGIYRVRK